METIYSTEQSDSTSADGGVKLVRATLERPERRLAVRAPDVTLGRAEAVIPGEPPRTWAAKHFWTEGPPGDQVTVYEFDEPLPAGQVLLRIPVR